MEPSPRRPAAHPDRRQERARRRVRRRVGSGTRCAWCWARRHDWCGVEAVASQAALAREQPFDEVVQGYFPEAMTTGERFDLISFNDVLEHVVDPWETLRECREFLTPDGRVLAAIPNVQYTPVSLGLLGGLADVRRVCRPRRTCVRSPERRSSPSSRTRATALDDAPPAPCGDADWEGPASEQAGPGSRARPGAWSARPACVPFPTPGSCTSW